MPIGRPVIGRHSRPFASKWPSDRKTFLAAYPDAADVDVRLLGYSDDLDRVVGTRPANWQVLPFGALPARDFLSGYGEVVKYGLLGDAGFFDWLETNGAAMAAGAARLRQYAVTRSVEMKAGIVSRDETEEGERALLNLGHTFCHALEMATGYSDRLLHGEGVAIGCALAFELSQRLGLCSQEVPGRVRAHLKAMGMKTDLADIPGDLPAVGVLLDLMAQDKKVIDGRLRFILARGIGDAFVADDVPTGRVEELLSEALAQRR